MKITDVKAVYPKWSYPKRNVWQDHFWQIVVRVESDAGVVGYGYGGGGEPGCMVVNMHLRELLIGRTIDSVDDIRSAWDHMYSLSLPYGRKGIQMMALSGLDLALWDLLGKAERKPVYELMGGLKKPAVRGYASGSHAERYRDLGFTANKFNPGRTFTDADYDKTVAAARRARQVLGEDALLMTDCYMGWDAPKVLKMAELVREFDIYFFEDILTPDLLEEQAEVRPKIKPINVAGGEHEFTRFGFRAIGKTGALDIWQPDLTWCGGITEGLRILDEAKKFGVIVTPHRGGEIWGLHFIAATDCDDLAEVHTERWLDAKNELWLDEPRVVDGRFTLTDQPGFGVRLNEAML